MNPEDRARWAVAKLHADAYEEWLSMHEEDTPDRLWLQREYVMALLGYWHHKERPKTPVTYQP